MWERDGAASFVRQAMTRYPPNTRISIPQFSMILSAMLSQHPSLTVTSLCRLLGDHSQGSTLSDVIIQQLHELSIPIIFGDTPNQQLAFFVPDWPREVENFPQGVVVPMPMAHTVALAPYHNTPILCHVVSDVISADQAIRHCVGEAKFVGVDSEWFPSFISGCTSKVFTL